MTFQDTKDLRVRFLERIAVDWDRDAVAIWRVNPLYFNEIDQIHAPAGSPLAIPNDRDLWLQ